MQGKLLSPLEIPIADVSFSHIASRLSIEFMLLLVECMLGISVYQWPQVHLWPLSSLLEPL